MTQSKNYEPRRMWKRGAPGRGCVSCGARATTHVGDQPFCHACVEWTRQAALSEWDDIAAAD